MKKLRISFAAIIAIVAIGLTVAAQAGAFENKAVRVITDCFRPHADLEVKLPSACNAADVEIPVGTQCNTIQAGSAIVSVGTPFYTPAQAQSLCLGGQYFCCFTVVESANCPAVAAIDLGEGAKKYAVNQIFCRATAQ